MLISPYLQHAYFSQCNLLNDRIIFRFHKLLDGNYLAGVSVSALKHHTVGALADFGQLFIFLHGAVCSRHLSKCMSFFFLFEQMSHLTLNIKAKCTVKMFSFARQKIEYAHFLYLLWQPDKRLALKNRFVYHWFVTYRFIIFTVQSMTYVQW